MAIPKQKISFKHLRSYIVRVKERKRLRNTRNSGNCLNITILTKKRRMIE